MAFSRALPLLLIPLFGTSIRLQSEDVIRELPVVGETPAEGRPEEAAPGSDRALPVVAPDTQDGLKTEAQVLDDKCNAAGLNSFGRESSWRRNNKCKCKFGYQLVCPGQDCQAIGRYFRAEDYETKNCICDHCATQCGDIVTNAMFRNSAWMRFTLKCKCPRGEVVRGADEACHGERYFGQSEMRGKGCECSDSNATTTITGGPPVVDTTTYIPLDDRIMPIRDGTLRSGCVFASLFIAAAATVARGGL